MFPRKDIHGVVYEELLFNDIVKKSDVKKVVCPEKKYK